MPIAFDASSVGVSTGTSPLTFSHTCTGSNLALIVGVVQAATTSSQTVTGVTYNGIALTQIGSVLNGGGSSSQSVYLWYLLNPATGANTISIAFSSILAVNAESISLTGVSSLDQNTTNTSGASPIVTGITPTTNGSWIVDVINDNASGGIVLSPAGVQQQRQNATNGGLNTFAMSTFGPVSPPNSVVNIRWNGSGTGFQLAHKVASFTPVTFSNASFKPNLLRPRAFSPGIAR